jgi:hypothetical protein
MTFQVIFDDVPDVAQDFSLALCFPLKEDALEVMK